MLGYSGGRGGAGAEADVRELVFEACRVVSRQGGKVDGTRNAPCPIPLAAPIRSPNRSQL